ncbi:ATP-binding cassette domain-containing protein [Ignavigranum ruoffiae]|uniref:ATP-binding cassette domain-containing protein n=1 Tax=Ignavigranum ruoffiae TaxID=89093 RepID=UPI0024AD9EC8|nr:ABC transporter ATP-binding protein [Ignavigranum ruoffiae]
MTELYEWTRLLKEMKRFKTDQLIILGLASVIIKLVMGFFMDSLMSHFTNHNFMNFSMLSLFFMIAALSLAWLMKLKISKQAQHQQMIELSLTQPFIQQINQIRGEVVDIQGIGSWITILTQDIKDYASLYANTLAEIFVGILSFFAALLFGFIKSAILTIVILLISLLTVFITHILSKKLENARIKEQDMNEVFKQNLLEVLSSISLFRIFHARKFGKQLFQKNYHTYRLEYLRREKLSFFVSAVSMGTGFILTTTWIVVALYLIKSGQLSIGSFLGFMLLDSYFTWVFFNLPSYYANLKIQSVSGERISSFYNDLYNQQEVGSIPVSEWQCLRLDNLSFYYNQDRQLVLNNLSLSIQPGDHLCIVGESGSGKSTLLKVLNGYYNIKNGSVQLDQQRISHLKELNQYISFVPQENIIFPGSIKDNITLGKEIQSDKLNEVLSVSGLKNWVASYKDGLETKIDSGIKQNLSEGQIQRIGIARALVEDTPIILLDEPTSALDQVNEKMIVDYLAQTEKTVILVTHRQTSIPKGFDQLILVNGQLQI